MAGLVEVQAEAQVEAQAEAQAKALAEVQVEVQVEMQTRRRHLRILLPSSELQKLACQTARLRTQFRNDFSRGRAEAVVCGLASRPARLECGSVVVLFGHRRRPWAASPVRRVGRFRRARLDFDA